MIKINTEITLLNFEEHDLPKITLFATGCPNKKNDVNMIKDYFNR